MVIEFRWEDNTLSYKVNLIDGANFFLECRIWGNFCTSRDLISLGGW